MNRLVKRILFILCSIGLVGTLAGCATTMSQNECLIADWHTVGLEDGARGQAMSRLARHRQQCAEFGVAPDALAYQQGRDEGLGYYCTLSNGLVAGKAGRNYSGTCPNAMEYHFLTGYRLGREMHRVQKEMHGNRAKVAKAETELQSDEATNERIAELRYQVRTLEREFGRMQSRLEYLEIEEQRIVVSVARSANLTSD